MTYKAMDVYLNDQHPAIASINLGELIDRAQTQYDR